MSSPTDIQIEQLRKTLEQFMVDGTVPSSKNTEQDLSQKEPIEIVITPPQYPALNIKYNFTCENKDCVKGYDAKAFCAHGMDFCSIVCCNKVLAPIREEEQRKEEERMKKNKYMCYSGPMTYGGSY